jgi:transposase
MWQLENLPQGGEYMQSHGGARSVEELNELVAAQQILIDQLRLAIDELGGEPATPGAPPGNDGDSNGDIAGLEDLEPVPDPDELVMLTPESCEICSADLSNAEVARMEQRQIIDLPEIRVRVTEYVAERRRCKNGHETESSFPEFVLGAVSYGPGIQALAKYLVIHQHLPLDQTAQILSDVLGSDVSTRSLAQIV